MKFILLQTCVLFVTFILEATPNHIPLKYKCLMKISNTIGHAYLICNNFFNLLYQWCALISAHATLSKQPTFPRQSNCMYTDCWMSTSKLLTPPLSCLISSKMKKGWIRLNDFTIYQWHEDGRIIRGIRFSWSLVDDETLIKLLTRFDCDLVQQRDSWGHLGEAQQDPSRYETLTSTRPKIHTNQCPGYYFGQNSSVSKSNWLQVLIFLFVLYGLL